MNTIPSYPAGDARVVLIEMGKAEAESILEIGEFVSGYSVLSDVARDSEEKRNSTVAGSNWSC